MRKLLGTLAFFCLLMGANAQNNAPQTGGHSPAYAAKWNPTGLLFGSLNFQGEYNFKHKKSLTFSIGIPMETTNSWLEIDEKKRDIKTKTFSAMAGYRMYMGKKSMAGFYFEPYLHYTKNDANTILDGELNGDQVEFYTTSAYSAFGLGGQLGVQALIAKRVTLDFFILGPEANIVKHNAVLKDITSVLPWDMIDAREAEQEIKETIGDLPLIGDKIEVAVDPANKTVSSEYKGFLPGFRAGLSIGIRF